MFKNIKSNKSNGVHSQPASTVRHKADLAIEWEHYLTTGKSAERTRLDFRCPICRSTIGQSQSFDLHALSSTDIPILLLNQPRMLTPVFFTLHPISPV